MTTRHIFPEQDATLIIRIPSSMKSWYADLANLTPDRNMSDFARDALRAYMMERGGEKWVGEEGMAAGEKVDLVPATTGPVFDGSWQVTEEGVVEEVMAEENLVSHQAVPGVVEPLVVESVMVADQVVEPPAEPPPPPSPILPEQPRDYPPIAPLERESD